VATIAIALETSTDQWRDDLGQDAEIASQVERTEGAPERVHQAGAGRRVGGGSFAAVLAALRAGASGVAAPSSVAPSPAAASSAASSARWRRRASVRSVCLARAKGFLLSSGAVRQIGRVARPSHGIRSPLERSRGIRGPRGGSRLAGRQRAAIHAGRGERG